MTSVPPPPPPTTAVVLLGRGTAYANATTELTQLAERLQAVMAAQGTPVLRVQPAWVDRSQPSLPQALDLCAQAQTIVILPVMAPDEPSLRRWLHKLVMRWRAAQPATAPYPRLIFAPPLLGAPDLAQVLARTVEAALGNACAQDVPAVVGDDPWERDPAAWSAVPEHQHHVLWCVGPRCTAKGATQLYPELARTVQANKELKKKVMLLQTSCQYPCNHGPLMIVYPGGHWYGPMTASTIAPVLTQQVLHGQVNEALLVHGPTMVDADNA